MMNFWTEIHTALLVGRTGTVRGAAERLRIHRATVSRHIDTLEDKLGTKLFLRHPNGYTPTELGRALIHAAETADFAFETFMELVASRSESMSGTLTVSAVSRAGWVIRPAMKQFHERYPKVTVRFTPSVELPKLELGETQIAVHAGAKPDHPDYVVIPYFSFPIGLYAHRDYLKQYGIPKSHEDLIQHRFAGSRDVYEKFGVQHHYGRFLTETNLALESNSPTIVFDGILSGIGLGLAAKTEAEPNEDLLEILPPKVPLRAQVWITTHMDMHRTRLVSEFVECLKAVKNSLQLDSSALADSGRQFRGIASSHQNDLNGNDLLPTSA